MCSTEGITKAEKKAERRADRMGRLRPRAAVLRRLKPHYCVEVEGSLLNRAGPLPAAEALLAAAEALADLTRDDILIGRAKVHVSFYGPHTLEDGVVNRPATREAVRDAWRLLRAARRLQDFLQIAL